MRLQVHVGCVFSYAWIVTDWILAAEGSPAEEEGTSRGFGLLGKVRKVRSSLDANTTPLAPPPKLRRMKTFANLRRPTPMTSLQGKSIETLARLGGYGYLMLTDLAPCPVQLPAYVVATLMFLHKYGWWLFLLRHDLTDPGFLQVLTLPRSSSSPAI